MKVEYIIQVYSNYGWCLDSVCGKSYETAKSAYFRKTIENPNKKFRIRRVKSSDCWWNDPFLAN